MEQMQNKTNIGYIHRAFENCRAPSAFITPLRISSAASSPINNTWDGTSPAKDAVLWRKNAQNRLSPDGIILQEIYRIIHFKKLNCWC